MAKPLPETGSFVHAYCTRCKDVLRHTVVALVDGRPARVKCNTCGGEHVFRAQAPDDAAAGHPAKGRGPRAITPEAAWREELAAAAQRGSKGRAYTAEEAFRAGDVLDHPSFGVGVVQRAVGPGKVLVLFRNGARALPCRSST